MTIHQKLAGISLAAVLALGVTTVAVTNGNMFNMTRASGNNTYSCNDIVFSETVGNPSATTDITNLASKKVTILDCSMTEWNHSGYTSDMTASAIKIGGQNDKAIGSVKLTLNKGMTASRLMVYAAGWLNDTNIKLGVNGNYQDLPQTTGEYEFLPYTFELGGQLSEIILSNNDAGTKSRVLISKIVLRLYNEVIDESSSNIDTDIELIADTNASECTVNGKAGMKVGTSKAGGSMSIKVGAGITKIVLYAAAWKGVSNLSLTLNNNTWTIAADDGISNNSPFTLVGNEEDFRHEITVNTTQETTYKITQSAAKRYVIWNVSVI